MYEALIVLGIVVLTQVIKRYVQPKFGTIGVHVLVLVLALIGVAIYNQTLADPNFAEFVTKTLQYLASAIAAYEVIIKRLGFSSFKD